MFTSPTRSPALSGFFVKPKLIVHCDWSVSDCKRWVATARLSPAGIYEVSGPALAGRTDSFFSRLRADTPAGSILAGFDFPIGVPRAYAAKAGVGSFPEMLRGLGTGSWAMFYNPAERAEEISLARPFYPLRPGGTSKRQLLDALGLHGAEELLRLCDRRTAARGNACEIFWTLGANQVGRAAIQGWRELLAPALRAGLIAIWPFDGELSELLESGGITVLEAYPAETYGHLGLLRGFGKRRRVGRQSQAKVILCWCERQAIALEPGLVASINDGFGERQTGEDAFDAFIGLLGMIEAVCDPALCLAPQDPAVRDIEGWTLGTDPASVLASGRPPSRGARGPARKDVTADRPRLESGHERLCPACGKKRFVRWPWGWDGHAAHGCPGVAGETPEERKRVYREQYLSPGITPPPS